MAFLALLRDLLSSDSPAVIAVFTIRSDNYERLQTAPTLADVHQHTLSLPSMPKGSYAEVVKGPIRRLAGTERASKIDDALVDALLADIEAGSAKDALPLLAFTLERLYEEYGSTGHLTLDHFNRLGRVRGSIEAAVERAFAAADEDARIPRDHEARLTLLRRGLIPWLAGIDPDTKAPRRRVARLSEIPAEARPLIDLLVEQRLLSIDVANDTGETTIEPAHEALLRQWGLLQGWLNDDTGLLTVLDSLKRGARDWSLNRKDVAWLAHKGSPASEQLSARPDFFNFLSELELEYIEYCRKESEDDARFRNTLQSEFGSDFQEKIERGTIARQREAESYDGKYRKSIVHFDDLDALRQMKADIDRRSAGGQRKWHPLPAQQVTYPNSFERDTEGVEYWFPCCRVIVTTKGKSPEQDRADGCAPLGFIPKTLLQDINVDYRRDVVDRLLKKDSVLYEAAYMAVPNLPEKLTRYTEERDKIASKRLTRMPLMPLIWLILIIASVLVGLWHRPP